MGNGEVAAAEREREAPMDWDDLRTFGLAALFVAFFLMVFGGSLWLVENGRHALP